MGMGATEWDSKQLSSCHIAVKTQKDSDPPELLWLKEIDQKEMKQLYFRINKMTIDKHNQKKKKKFSNADMHHSCL